MNDILKISIFILLFLTGALLIGIYWTFYKPLPGYTDTIEIDVLENDVNIHWDPYGTPHIYAVHEEDLYFTIGYIHAQERLWQMTLSQLSAEGRFAEFLGEDFIQYDIHQRTLGFWDTAKKIETETPDSLKWLLQKYADGVNYYVRQNSDSLPLEFSLLDVKPIEWSVTHSLAMSRLMAWDQNMHWWSELTYATLSEELDAAQIRQLIPVYDDRDPTMIMEHQLPSTATVIPFLESERSVRNLLSKRGSPFGSNAWAVSGAKTESGYPLLAGDPHMGLSIPGFWYELYVDTPEFKLGGATIPGSPFIVLGQNREMAWSMTNIMADDTDFFVEQIAEESQDFYITDSTTVPQQTAQFERRTEVIRVKDRDDLIHVVRSSRNGPVISDIHPDSGLLNDKVVTMKWTGHNISHELWALYKMNRSGSMNEFRNAIEIYKTPGMNFIYADSDDNIAIFTGAAIPVRNHNPLFFRPGWNPEYEWQSFLSFDQLPHIVNPERGFVSHANNKLHPDNYPHYIGTFWEPPSRIIRINQLLESSDSLTVEDMQLIQNDVYSEHSRDITEIIVPVLRSSEDSNEFSVALSYLENWDYEYHPNSVAASLFDLFFMNLTENILKDDLGESAYRALIRQEHLPVMIITRLLESESYYFNITTTPDIESSSDIIVMSMRQTLDQLQAQFGPEPFEWRWENLHTLTLQPPLMGDAAALPDAPTIFKLIIQNVFTKGPYPANGHGMSINKSQYSWLRPFETEMGPSIRRIIDFSSPGRSLSVLPTGQSGNPFSANYGDQTNLWLEGRYRFVYQDSTFFQQTSFQTMSLIKKD